MSETETPPPEKPPKAPAATASPPKPTEAEAGFAAEVKDWSTAEDRVRKASTWVITAYAAIAGALLTGIQLTALANTEGSVEGWAVVATMVTILGALVVIVANVSVLVATPGSLRAIVKRGEGKQSTLTQLATGNLDKHLANQYADNIVPTLATQLNAEQKEISTLSSYVEYFDSEMDSKPAAPRRRVLNLTMARTKNYMKLEAVRYRFKVALRWLIIGGLMSSAGIIWFAQLTSVAESEESTESAPAAEVTAARPVLIEPASGDTTDLGGALDESCADESIEAFLLTAAEDEASALIVPAPGCPAEVVDFSTDDVVVRDACPVEIPPAPDDTTTTTTEPAGKSASQTTTTTSPDATESEGEPWVESTCV